MSLFKKFAGKSKEDTAKADKVVDKKPMLGAEETGTVLRQSDKATPITKEKERMELTALELAEQKDWEVKTLPVWQPGDVILETYEVEDVISGGMGHVYITNHMNWNVKLAIKSPNEMMLSDKSNFARILREANSWTELGLHPNIAYCYYVRNIEDVPHIFVEYVDGGNLRKWLEDGKCIDYRLNLDLALQFCHGMEYAHSRGMIHRDIKPENILMTKEGALLITDFGLVRSGNKILDKSQTEKTSKHREQSVLTFIGDEMGTWGYMSPEQKENPHEVDERTDIFAFGICLYEMFCGNRPYEITFGPRQEPPDPRVLSGDKSFPSELEKILMKCVKWDPSDRYKNFKEIRLGLSETYRRLYKVDSPHAELEIFGIEADALNNRGVSLLELGRKEEAIISFKEALKRNKKHLEANYNIWLLDWRSGKIDDLEIINRLKYSGPAYKNGTKGDRTATELAATIHMERLDLDSAKEILKHRPGAFEQRFSNEMASPITCLRAISGHKDKVRTVAVTPDGRYVVSGGKDKTIQVCNLKTGRRKNKLKGHWDSICSIAITSDGRYAVSGSRDESLKIWDLKKGKCLKTLKGHMDEGHEGSVRSVAISPDNYCAASGSSDRTIKTWELESGYNIMTFEGLDMWHDNSISSVVISSDAQYVISGSKDNTLIVWNLKTGKSIKKLRGHSRSVNSVVITPDNRHVISGSSDKTLKVWELDTGRCIKTLKGHTGQVNSVAVTPDGRFAISGSNDTFMKIWILKTGKCLRTLRGHEDVVTSVAITPDGHYAISGSSDNTLRVWSLNIKKINEAYFALCRPKSIETSRKESGQRIETLNKIHGLIQKKLFAKAYQELFKEWKSVNFSEDKTIWAIYKTVLNEGKIKDLRSSQMIINLSKNIHDVRLLKITPDGRYAISGTGGRTLNSWDLEKAQHIQSIKPHKSSINSVAISQNSMIAASGSDDRTIRLWKIKNGKRIQTLKGHSKAVISVAMSANGKFVLSGSSDKTIKLWDTEKVQCIHTFKGHTKPVNYVAISTDGEVAISASLQKNTFKLWEVINHRFIGDFEGHSGKITSVALSENGKFALSGSEDKTLKLWNLKEKQCIQTLQGHTDTITSLDLFEEDKFALSGSRENTLRMWELETGQCIRILEAHSGPVTSVSVSRDRSFAISASTDKTMKLWHFIWDLEFN